MRNKKDTEILKEITKEYLMDHSSAGKFSRGYDYYKSGAVKKIIQQGMLITANVFGREKYEVNIDISKSPVLFNCNCPSAYIELCKHSVAVGLTIIDTPDVIKKIQVKQKQTKDVTIDIEDLITKTSSVKKDAFLKEVLSENPELKEKFLIKILGQVAIASNLTIESIREEIKEQLEELDFGDHQELCHYGNEDSESSYYGYKEEYEVLADAADHLINEILDSFTKEMKNHFKTGNIIEASKCFIGILSGILIVDDKKFVDEYDIFFDGIKPHLLDFINDIFSEFLEGFENSEKSSEALNIVVEQFFKEMIFLTEMFSKKDELLELGFLKPLILEMIQEQKIADYIKSKINKISLDNAEKNEIKMKIAEICKDNSLWLKIAEKSYLNNNEIGKQLLEFYKKEKRVEDFIKIGKELLKKSSIEFSQFLYEIELTKTNSELYIDVLEKLIIVKEEIILYRELKNIAGSIKTDAFINKIEKKHKKNFWVQLLVEENRFDVILNHIKKNSNPWDFKIFINPIINIYPEECFKIISHETSKFLSCSVGRKHYQEAAQWLLLLKKIKDKNIKKLIKNYINSLLKTYYNRRAMKDEFNRAGLLDI